MRARVVVALCVGMARRQCLTRLREQPQIAQDSQPRRLNHDEVDHRNKPLLLAVGSRYSCPSSLAHAADDRERLRPHCSIDRQLRGYTHITLNTGAQIPCSGGPIFVAATSLTDLWFAKESHTALLSDLHADYDQHGGPIAKNFGPASGH